MGRKQNKGARKNKRKRQRARTEEISIINLTDMDSSYNFELYCAATDEQIIIDAPTLERVIVTSPYVGQTKSVEELIRLIKVWRVSEAQRPDPLNISIVTLQQEQTTTDVTSEPSNLWLATAHSLPPQLGERLLLLILTKEERVNIPGDLEEEFRRIAAKHGPWYAKLWYYKQVAASAWPMICKAVKWAVWAWIANIGRRII